MTFSHLPAICLEDRVTFSHPDSISVSKKETNPGISNSGGGGGGVNRGNLVSTVLRSLKEQKVEGGVMNNQSVTISPGWSPPGRRPMADTAGVWKPRHCQSHRRYCCSCQRLRRAPLDGFTAVRLLLGLWTVLDTQPPATVQMTRRPLKLEATHRSFLKIK